MRSGTATAAVFSWSGAMGTRQTRGKCRIRKSKRVEQVRTSDFLVLLTPPCFLRLVPPLPYVGSQLWFAVFLLIGSLERVTGVTGGHGANKHSEGCAAEAVKHAREDFASPARRWPAVRGRKLRRGGVCFDVF